MSPWIAMPAAAATVVTAPALAQVPRAPVLAEVGACLARNAPRLSRELLSTQVGSREETDRASRLFLGNDGCIQGRAVLSSRIGEIRGIVAEAVLETDEPALATLRTATPRPAVRAVQTEGRAFVDNYARCLADADPARSVALLSTPHQSPEERDAFLAYGDTLNDCMPHGVAYRIDRFDVRNHIAARLYEQAAASESGAY